MPEIPRASEVEWPWSVPSVEPPERPPKLGLTEPAEEPDVKHVAKKAENTQKVSG